MIQQALNGMIALMMAKLMLNDVPHYLFEDVTMRTLRVAHIDERCATPAQLRLIAIKSARLKIPEPRVKYFGEAGRMIRELMEEEKYREQQKKLKSGSPPTPTGTCYPDAWRYVMQHPEAVLVHGTAISLGKRISHAWVELPDGTVWEPSSQAILPIERVYALVDPIVEDRYTADEAAHMLSVGKHGPWSAEERMKYIGR